MKKPDTYPGGRGLTSDGIIFIIRSLFTEVTYRSIEEVVRDGR